jgi:hypothetical protein
VYDANGEWLDIWSGAVSSVSFAPRIFVDTADVVYLRVGLGSGLGKERQLTRYIRLRMDGTVMDTIATPLEDIPEPDRIAGGARVPFFPTYLAAWSPLGYFVTCYTGRYAIDIRDGPAGAANTFSWSAGDPVRSIRRRVAPVRSYPAERADHVKHIELYMATDGNAAGWTWNVPQIPAEKAFIQSIMVGDDGRIWARVYQEAELDAAVEVSAAANSIERRWLAPVVYDVFEPSGVYVGRVRFPEQLRVHSARDDVVWATHALPDGEPKLVRFRVRWQ